MAAENQVPTDLTIDLGDDLSPDEFVGAVRNFLGYVNEITNALKGDGADINWTVRVREGSALIGVEPNESAPPSRLATIYKKVDHGTRALASGDIEGARLPEKAIDHMKHLSDLVGKHKNGKGVCLWVKRRPIEIGTGIAETIRERRLHNYHDFGTIEGRLAGIMDAAGGLRIKVNDYLYPRAINCVVPEDLLEKVFSCFRQRVEIEGRIHYRRDGTPISIEVEVIDQLPEDDELPTADDVRGIMARA